MSELNPVQREMHTNSLAYLRALLSYKLNLYTISITIKFKSKAQLGIQFTLEENAMKSYVIQCPYKCKRLYAIMHLKERLTLTLDWNNSWSGQIMKIRSVSFHSVFIFPLIGYVVHISIIIFTRYFSVDIWRIFYSLMSTNIIDTSYALWCLENFFICSN